MKQFTITVGESELEDLRARIDAARWPDELPGTGGEFGPPLAEVRRLARYWRHSYDWRAAEAEINAYPQFLTEIDGQRIHFLHVRCERQDALPLVLTHGWPGSFVEFLDVIEPLSRDFHLVIPSLPGWGFSGPTHERGWDVDRVARAWAELMRRLGYDRYGAQGGDWGSNVSRALSDLDAEHVAAIHLNYLPTPPPPGADPAELSEQDTRRLDQTRRYLAHQPAARVLNSTRPQAAAFALNDSPVGLLAWLLDVMTQWAAPGFPIGDDRLLTNVMVHWLSGSAATAPRLHRESGRPRPYRTTQPVGIAVLPHDITRAIRPYAERVLPVARWTELPEGGHFPGLEVPGLLAGDIREFFLSVASPAAR